MLIFLSESSFAKLITGSDEVGRSNFEKSSSRAATPESRLKAIDLSV